MVYQQLNYLSPVSAQIKSTVVNVAFSLEYDVRNTIKRFMFSQSQYI